jgi:CysZ protein
MFGFKLIGTSGLRHYALVPLLINIIIFGSGLYFMLSWVESLRLQFVAWLPSWLDFLSYVLWPLFIISAGAIIVYVFTTLTQILASPFNAVLSEKVEEHLGLPTATEECDLNFWQALKSAPAREISKFIKSLKWIALMIILSFLPGLNIFVPVIAGWLMAIDYLDFPADNRGMPFKDSLAHIHGKRFHHLCFGLLVSLISFVPLLNLFVVPAAVAGGTALWHKK